MMLNSLETQQSDTALMTAEEFTMDREPARVHDVIPRVIRPEGRFKIREIQKERILHKALSRRLSSMDPVTLRVAWNFIDREELTASIELMNDDKLFAPAAYTWSKRDKNAYTSPAEFTLSMYGERLGRGFTSAHLRKVDFGLYEALHQWRKSHDVPGALYLPTKNEWLEKLAQAIKSGVPILNLSGEMLAQIGRAELRRDMV